MDIFFAPQHSAGVATVAALVALSAWFAITYVFHKADPREPPYIRSGIPLVGHIIGMMRYGAKYFDIVNERSKYRIFTLPMLTTRNYIISDATLAGHVQRNNTTLSFYSLIVEVTRRLIAFDDAAAKISMYNMNGEHGPGGLMEAVHEMGNRLLAPGLNLDSITATQMEQMALMLNDILPPHGSSITVNLYAWQRHIFSFCNMYAIYGPGNIFARHPDLEDAFWTFEDGMLGLVVDICPSITARKAHLARQRVLDGLIEYVKTERYKHACKLIQERVQTNLSFSMSEEMAGHAELILMFGILGNAVPSNFWLIANIFSHPGLLERIRIEVAEAIGIEQPEPSELETITIHAKRINIRSCPLLYSCYRETLRDISLLSSPRMVMEDTLLPNGPSDQGYLLKKNSILQIAGGVIHHDQDIWGDDADAFNPERFLVRNSNQSPASSPTAVPLPQKVPSAAFRAYGGGTVLCPGRHFAQSELMSLAALLAVGFDICQDGGDPLRLPPKDDTRIPLSVMKPIYDPLVRIQRRQGWEMVRWNIVL